MVSCCRDIQLRLWEEETQIKRRFQHNTTLFFKCPDKLFNLSANQIWIFSVAKIRSVKQICNNHRLNSDKVTGSPFLLSSLYFFTWRPHTDVHTSSDCFSCDSVRGHTNVWSHGWLTVGLERSQLVGLHSGARSPPKMAATTVKLTLNHLKSKKKGLLWNKAPQNTEHVTLV